MAALFDSNPGHPSFRSHTLRDTARAHHIPGSVSITIVMNYRAIYVVDEQGRNIWYWIGSHADYDKFVGS